MRTTAMPAGCRRLFFRRGVRRERRHEVILPRGRRISFQRGVWREYRHEVILSRGRLRNRRQSLARRGAYCAIRCSLSGSLLSGAVSLSGLWSMNRDRTPETAQGGLTDGGAGIRRDRGFRPRLFDGLFGSSKDLTAPFGIAPCARNGNGGS